MKRTIGVAILAAFFAIAANAQALFVQSLHGAPSCPMPGLGCVEMTQSNWVFVYGAPEATMVAVTMHYADAAGTVVELRKIVFSAPGYALAIFDYPAGAKYLDSSAQVVAALFPSITAAFRGQHGQTQQ